MSGSGLIHFAGEEEERRLKPPLGQTPVAEATKDATSL
jgi:hypothetical protein